MCKMNHFSVPAPIATPELGIRALHYKDEIGLTEAQVQEIVRQGGAWRRTYVGHIEEIVRLGEAIDQLLLARQIDIDRVHELLDERAAIVMTLDRAFVDAWNTISQVLTDENDRRLDIVYRREFEKVPHPVLGSSASGPIPEFAGV